MSGQQDGRLSLGKLLVFSLSTIPVQAMGVVLFVYLPPYLSRYFGLSLTAIGAVWFAVRAVDLFIDPVLAHFMDRTDTRFGRYRVWLAAGVPIFMLSSVMLFWPPRDVGSLYLFIWLFAFYIGNSLLVLAQQAWSAALSSSYGERNRIFGVGIAVGVAAAVVSLLVPIFAPGFGLTAKQGVEAMALSVIVMTPLGVGLAVLFTPERINRSAAAEHFAWRDYWEIVSKPEVIRLFFAQVALTLGPGWMSAMYVFYFHDVRGYSQAQSSILLVLYILVGVAGAPLTARIAQRIGKHRTLMFTTLAFSLALLTIPLVPQGNLFAGMPIMAWCGFMAAGFGLVINSMMADVGDEIRLHQGKERISLLYSVLSFAGKLTAAFAIGLSLPLLESFGYVAKEGYANTPQAIEALKWIFITGPTLFVMLGGICVWGWRLDAKRHAVIRAELDARDAAALGEASVLSGLGATTAAATGQADAASPTPLASP